MNMRIMIVDYDFNARRRIENSINWVENDFELVGEASNGEEALTLMPHVNPDIIMTEIRMPKMDGISFINAAKKRWPDKKYIIISSYSHFDYLREAMRSEAYDYLLKPVDADKLNETLQRIKEKL